MTPSDVTAFLLGFLVDVLLLLVVLLKARLLIIEMT
jgi:hypothetical protein